MAALLVDEGIRRDLVRAMVTQGFSALHWLDIGTRQANDSIVFLEAQRRGLSVFTHNREDFVLLATAWRNWGLGDHQGVIAPMPRKQQLAPLQLYPVMVRYCADNSLFVNRIELF
jgi:hypothetical protein